jgi:PAS domain S-box-containing protein
MTDETVKILLVEDNSGDARLVREMLARTGDGRFDIEWVTRLGDGLERLGRGGIDVVLLDLGLPDSQGLDTFARANAQSPQVPFLVLTGLADETVGVTAVRQGAQDYLIKGEVDGKLLLRAIRYATERKKAELALEAERKKLYAVLNSLPAFVHLKGADFTIQFANRRFKEVFGEPEHRSCYEVLRDRSEPCEHCRVLDVLKTKVPQKFEWASSLNGNTFEVYHYPFCTEDNLLVLTLGIDITERKRVEKALRESEERFRTIYEGAAIGIILRDGEGRLIACNPAYQEMLGYSEYELKSTSLTDIIHPEDVKEALALCQEILSGKQDRLQMESRYRRKERGYFWGRVTCSRAKGPQGEPLYSIGMVEDITGRKEAEASVRHLTHELMRAQEQEKHKISLELHDTVAQELASLKIGLENLRDNTRAIPDEKVSSQITVLLEILQQPLNSVRNLSYELRPPDLEHFGLFQAIKNHCEEIAARTGLKIDFLAAGIEATHLDYEAAINLYRIIQEGLANVWRHARAENVSIRLVASHPKIILRLEDDGQGFNVAEKVAPNQLDRRLGLLGMKERVAFLGGEMHLESQLNKGTKIIIEIPWSREGHDAKEEDFHS